MDRERHDERSGEEEDSGRGDHVGAERLPSGFRLSAARPGPGPAFIGGDERGGLVRHSSSWEGECATESESAARAARQAAEK